MKVPVVVVIVFLAIDLALPTFAQQKDTLDPQIAQQIRVLAMKYHEAINRNDAAAVAALYTEDAVNVLPGGIISRSAGHRKRLGTGFSELAS
jgi:hypothetical protein